MQNFQNDYTKNNIIQEQQKLLEEKKKERNKKFKAIFKAIIPYIIIILVISSIIATIVFLCKHFKKNLMDTNSYDFFEMEINAEENKVYYSYLWKDNKLEKCSIYNTDLHTKIYISDNNKNYIVVEDWGRNGKVINKKVVKFYFTEDKYYELVKEFEWEDETN